MAEIVLGIGTSHSPLLTFDAKSWADRASDDLRNEALTLSDGRTVSYAKLLAERGPLYAEQASEQHLADQVLRVQRALKRLAAAIEHASPDIVLIVGDDQGELYQEGNTPSLAIYYGEEIVMRPLAEIMTDPPKWLGAALHSFAMDKAHRFPGAPDFALSLINQLMDSGIDLGVASKVADPKVCAFGHAFGFIAHTLLQRRGTPIVPILLNTYYPPNVIRPGRCYDIGLAIADAVAAIPDNKRVAVVASGGLSHFVTDADLDTKVLRAMETHDSTTLRSLPMAALRSGSSEILCWVMMSGSIRQLEHIWTDYIPVYRTPAGSGIGLAFAIWEPAGPDHAGRLR